MYFVVVFDLQVKSLYLLLVQATLGAVPRFILTRNGAPEKVSVPPFSTGAPACGVALGVGCAAPSQRH